MRCDTFEKLVPSYLSEEIEGDERRAWREHLRSCRRCGDVAARHDPTLAFVAGVSLAPAPPEEIEACVDGVRSLIRHQALDRRLHRGERHRWLAVAAAMVLALATGVLWPMLGAPTASAPTVAAEVAAPAPPPTVEVLGSDEIRVYQFSSATDADTVAVVIVDPSLEL